MNCAKVRLFTLRNLGKMLLIDHQVAVVDLMEALMEIARNANNASIFLN